MQPGCDIMEPIRLVDGPISRVLAGEVIVGTRAVVVNSGDIVCRLVASAGPRYESM